MASMLLKKKGSIMYFDNDLLTFLREKKNDKARRLLEGSNHSLWTIYVKDSSKATLLHYAASDGNEDIVKYLIDSGSEVDAQDNLGRTPWVLAVKGDHEIVAEILLKAKANINIINIYGESALQMILKFEPPRYKTTRKLFKHMSRLAIMKIDLAKNLREAHFSLSRVAAIGNIELIKLLLDQGFHAVNGRDSSGGETALHTAIQRRDLEMVRVLIENGADVDALDASKATPLSHLYNGAHDNGSNLIILKVLLSRAALLTTSDSDGYMQIHKLLVFGCKEAVKLILQRVGDLSISDKTGSTVVHYVAENRHTDVIEILKDCNFDVNFRKKDGWTPLHTAASKHLPHAVKFLLERGADVHAAQNAFDQETPLNVIFLFIDDCPNLDEAKKCTRLLLEYGANALDYKNFDLVLQRYDNSMRGATGRLEKTRSTLTLIEPVITHLAVSKARGIEVSELITLKIAPRPSWSEYFNMCKTQVDRMSNTTVYGNLTLLKFLTESEKKIIAYVRNKELVSELRRIINGFQTNSPYLDLIQSRLTKAVHLAELKEKAITTICRLINLKNNAHYLAAEYIVDYLSNDDMRRLSGVMQFCLNGA